MKAGQRKCGEGLLRKGCNRPFTPRRFRNDRHCERCRDGFLAPVPRVQTHGGVTSYSLGLFGDHSMVSTRASLDRGPRLKPAEVDARSRVSYPTADEWEADFVAASGSVWTGPDPRFEGLTGTQVAALDALDAVESELLAALDF